MLRSYNTIIIITASLVVFGFNKFPQPMETQTPPKFPGFRIVSPKPNDVLQGNIPIIANISTANFTNIVIEFTYKDNPTNTWFPIPSIDPTSGNNYLGDWDTTTITDGIYTLRIMLYTKENNEYIEMIPDLRVRNYSIIETSTPEPIGKMTISSETPISTLPRPGITPIPISKNPLQISVMDIFQNIKLGAVASIVLFLIGLLFFKIRQI